MATYAEFQAADRRATILQALIASAGYRAPSELLRAFLDAAGHTVSTDRLRADLAWLADVELLVVDETAPGVTVARLTMRGQDVAEGRTEQPGVRRPRAGA